ncbi:MAG: hypothetical protein ACJA1G_001344 [Qipengyuania sp.]|jgi:hypothetical protein
MIATGVPNSKNRRFPPFLAEQPDPDPFINPKGWEISPTVGYAPFE